MSKQYEKVSVSLKTETYKKGKEIAEKRDRSFSSIVQELLQKFIRSHKAN